MPFTRRLDEPLFIKTTTPEFLTEEQAKPIQEFQRQVFGFPGYQIEKLAQKTPLAPLAFPLGLVADIATPLPGKASRIVKKIFPIIPKELRRLVQEARSFDSARLWKLSYEGTSIDKVNAVAKQLIDAGFIEKPPAGMISKKVIPDFESFYKIAVKSVEPKIAISKDLEPLLQEARTYKSAEEFVKEIRNENVFYRGVRGGKTLTDKPIFISRNADLALSYSPQYPNVELAEKDLQAFIRKPGRTLDIFDSENARNFYNKITGKSIPKDEFHRGYIYGSWSKVINQAQKEGYDYIRHLGEGQFKGVVDEEFVVLNPKKSLTQLTDFYNQAIKGFGALAAPFTSLFPFRKKEEEPLFIQR